jgi:hypothetical protein
MSFLKNYPYLVVMQWVLIRYLLLSESLEKQRDIVYLSYFFSLRTNRWLCTIPESQPQVGFNLSNSDVIKKARVFCEG